MKDKKFMLIIGDLSNLGDQFIGYTEAVYLQKRYINTIINANLKIVIVTWENQTEETKHWFKDNNIFLESIKNQPYHFFYKFIGNHYFLGGGQIIRDTSWKYLLYIMLVAFTTSIGNSSIQVIGSGCAKIASKFKRYAWAYILSKCQFIGIRDKSSLSNFTSNFPKLGHKISLTNDIAFLSEFHRQQVGICDPNNKICLVALAHDAMENRKINKNLLISLFSEMVKHNIINKIHFVAHDPRTGMDLEISTDCAATIKETLHLNSEFVECLSLDELLTQYKMASVIVTGRLHSLIMGALELKPVITINDDTGKLTPFANEYGYPIILENDTIKEQIDSAIDNIKKHSTTFASEILNKHRKEAEINFKYFNTDEICQH